MPTNYYRIKQLASNKGNQGLLPISSSTIWRLVAAGKFPKPSLKVGERIVAWSTSDINLWIEGQQY